MKGKVIIYKDGSYHYFEDTPVYEFEQDKDYLVTINLENLNDYHQLNKVHDESDYKFSFNDELMESLDTLTITEK